MLRKTAPTRGYKKPIPLRTRIPLVYNANGYPFIWHNLERDRIEIVHGEKLTVLQLMRGTTVIRTPWKKEYRNLIEFPVTDLDGRAVASWLGGSEDMEIDLFVIRHSRQVTCFAVPKHTLFQVQHETSPRAA